MRGLSEEEKAKEEAEAEAWVKEHPYQANLLGCGSILLAIVALLGVLYLVGLAEGEECESPHHSSWCDN